MTIHVGIAYPPHREDAVAEFHVTHDEVVEIPAEMFRKEGRMMIALFSRTGGVAWEYPLSDFLGAIEDGKAVLGGS